MPNRVRCPIGFDAHTGHTALPMKTSFASRAVHMFRNHVVRHSEGARGNRVFVSKAYAQAVLGDKCPRADPRYGWLVPYHDAISALSKKLLKACPKKTPPNIAMSRTD